jgi:hypothetical protein
LAFFSVPLLLSPESPAGSGAEYSSAGCGACPVSSRPRVAAQSAGA